MDEFSGAAEVRKLPPGVCPKADSLGAPAGDTLDVASLIAVPRPISMPPLVYPKLERQHGWEGDVPVHLLLRPDGLVARVDVGDGRDPFVMAAADAACGARFTIVRSASNEPAYVWLTYTFAFRLNIGIPPAAPRAATEESAP